MSEKKYNNLWLYVSIALMVLILVLLWVIFLGRKNTNSDDFEKKTYCNSFYDKVYKQYNEEYDRRDNVMSRFMSDFNLFYSKKLNTCVVSYIVDTTVYSDNENITNYKIEDYLNKTNIYSCSNSDKNLDDYNPNCYSDMQDKLTELR